MAVSFLRFPGSVPLSRFGLDFLFPMSLFALSQLIFIPPPSAFFQCKTLSQKGALVDQFQEFTVDPAPAELTVDPLFLPTIRMETTPPMFHPWFPNCPAVLPSEYFLAILGLSCSQVFQSPCFFLWLPLTQTLIPCRCCGYCHLYWGL